MDNNNLNHDNVQPNQGPNPDQTSQKDTFADQYAQYNQPRNDAFHLQPDADNGQPQQSVQPDNQQYQPQQPVPYDNQQYQPQQPVPYDNQQSQPQQPVPYGNQQYQPQQPDSYNPYQNNAGQTYDYNQGGYQQPPYRQGNVYNPVPTNRPTGAAKAFSIVSLVCGILAVVFGCCGLWGLIFSIPGAVFGIISKSKCKSNNAFALVGMILSFIGLGFAVIMTVVIFVGGANYRFSSPYFYNW